ncbi:MAG: CYTH domain-containing protein [Clostridiales Family XIII bacterium]|jgi:inorganic triphosphatase YgiF|nr:CYTH domain-containing protein [Clostridiales Family XIII bacterium]
MEIELKYRIKSRELLEKIERDKFLASIAERDSTATVMMKAAYFDTEDRILMRNDIAFRIRKEGDRLVGTLKWGDNDMGVSGLYAREEISVPVADDSCFLSPDPYIFKDSREGQEMLEAVSGQSLVLIFETVFTRKRFRIDSDGTICEISLDTGEIIAGDRRESIQELEIELFSGSKDELVRIGDRIAGAYDLSPEPLSKFARGRALIEGRVIEGKKEE